MTIPGMQALLLTADPSLITDFSCASNDLGIDIQPIEDVATIGDRLSRTKYDALVLDLDTVPSALPVLGDTHQTVSGKNALIFAIATQHENLETALQRGAHFVLRRPLGVETIRRTLYAAYDLMRAERRRYFRFAIELPVVITLSTTGDRIQCSTMNISRNGMGIKCPVPLRLAETVEVFFELPTGFAIRAFGIAIWDDKHGKSGLRIHCSEPMMRERLDSWLDSQFHESGKETGSTQ